MIPSIDEILAATEHLPTGAVLQISQVTWDEYERVLEEFETRHLRVSYDDGRFDGTDMSFYHLVGEGYVLLRESHVLPSLTSAMFQEALKAGKAGGLKVAVQVFRTRIQSLK